MSTQLSAVTATGGICVVIALITITLACPPFSINRNLHPNPLQGGHQFHQPTARVFYMSTSTSDPIKDWAQASAACEALGLRLPMSVLTGDRISRINEFIDRLDDTNGSLPDSIGFWRWNEATELGISCPAVTRTRSTNETLFDVMVNCTDLLHGFMCEGSIDLNMAANMGSIWCDGVCAIFFESSYDENAKLEIFAAMDNQ